MTERKDIEKPTLAMTGVYNFVIRNIRRPEKPEMMLHFDNDINHDADDKPSLFTE